MHHDKGKNIERLQVIKATYNMLLNKYDQWQENNDRTNTELRYVKADCHPIHQ